MPKSSNQKLKLLYIADYLRKHTDEEHCVTTSEIIDMLDDVGIEAERKSIYSDIEALRFYGMDINISKGRNGGISLLSKEFQVAELKLLVDAVQSSRFITKKKSFDIIKKLSELVSTYEKEELQREVYIINRIKNDNESIYYSTDTIHKAIQTDRMISFKYFNHGADKKKIYHNKGNPIKVSPFGLQYDSEKYYLIAFDGYASKIKHYRVDKMETVEIIDESRDGKGYFRKFDLAEYANATVTMFSGEVAPVTLKLPEKFAGAVIDKFGKKCRFIPTDDGEFSVVVNVTMTPTLYSWVFTFGGEIKITAPEKAVNEYKAQLKSAMEGMEKQ
ncbi:MAG: WYL domain-containing protein [Clostridia bacterium]|nr:WYL domain-containing protein [Clostridia bacterium]